MGCGSGVAVLSAEGREGGSGKNVNMGMTCGQEREELEEMAHWESEVNNLYPQQ